MASPGSGAHERNTGGHDSQGNARGGDRTSGGSAGRPGGVGNVGQTNSRPTTTSYGAPIHYGGSNPVTGGVNLAQSPQRWATTVDRVKNYNQAARNWNNSGTGITLGNTLNAFAPMGFSMQAPEFNQPATYTGGDYHLGLNPAGLAVGLGSAAAGVPGPWGSIAGKAYNALGFHDLVLGGPDVPKDWTKWGGSSLPGASMTGAPSQGQPSQGQQVAGNPHATGGSPMAAFPQTPGGASFGAQPGPPAIPGGAPAPTPAFGGLPNHTLPQGYQSLFPNSLTEQDKALLYGKALMG